MAMSRSRPGSPNVRKSGAVGPDYPDENYTNPWNMGIDEERDDPKPKGLRSPTLTTTGPGIPLKGNYDKYWGDK